MMATALHSLEEMRLLTIQEVAETMRISEKTVRRLIKRGDLVAYKTGDRGQLRVKEQDLDEYIESQRVSPRMGEQPKEEATDKDE